VDDSAVCEYENRQLLELYLWEEFRPRFFELERLILSDGTVSAQLKFEIHTVGSVSFGCPHCQSHGAFALQHHGVDPERIQALWSFEDSEVFTDAERTAYRLARDAMKRPSAVTAAHHQELRAHYDDQQIREIFTMVAWSAFLNTFSDTAAVVTDNGAAIWATEHLTSVGWSVGKHTGQPHEQRPDLFRQKASGK
jgi:alkylhydroperoxidase family enzyme